jgi:hypothetical protein
MLSWSKFKNASTYLIFYHRLIFISVCWYMPQNSCVALWLNGMWSFQNYKNVLHEHVNIMQVKISSLSFQSIHWIAVLKSCLSWIHLILLIVWLSSLKKQFLDDSCRTLRFVLWSCVEEIVMLTCIKYFIKTSNSKVKCLHFKYYLCLFFVYNLKFV